MDMVINYRFYFIVLLMLSLSCEQTSDHKPTDGNDTGRPVADAGPDQESVVGGYVILDGTNSSPGEAHKITWWVREQDEENPEEVFISSHCTDCSTVKVGFITEGVYKFYLVVNNGIAESEPDEVVVTVRPRENILFKDPALEIQARFALENPAGDISEEDLLSIDSLRSNMVVVRPKTTSLEGIEKCTNLHHLAIGLQRITDLSPLSNLHELKYLDLTQNRMIEDISPLSGLTQLRYLNLDTNKIKNISPLKDLDKLVYLNLMYNSGITDITAIENMKYLEELWLARSPLRDISPLRNLTNMRQLFLADSEITDITPLSNLTKLHYLFLSGNSIEDISSLDGLIQLERLHLDGNKVTDISPLEHLTNVHLFDLPRNKIEDIYPLVKNSGLGHGNFVNLRGNPLNDKSINEYIPALRERGVIVLWE
jgi:hypothetical protein